MVGVTDVVVSAEVHNGAVTSSAKSKPKLTLKDRRARRERTRKSQENLFEASADDVTTSQNASSDFVEFAPRKPQQSLVTELPSHNTSLDTLTTAPVMSTFKPDPTPPPTRRRPG